MISMTGCSLTTEREAALSPAEVVKSPADDRDYRYLTLANGLNVLLVSDSDTDKSAAAVDVNTGSYMDPDKRLGLAHFLEHMLFMGTEKYPDVDSYSEFIRANGGSSNAYTADVRTNYHFDINSNQLESALDRLAQFFIAPKLAPEYVERERNAVDSEYRLHAREDSWRLVMALNATSNPAHPKSRFNIGSLDTLNNDDGELWKDLRAFYDRYYVAANMSLVVYGRESIDQLEKMVKTSFADVPAGDKPDLTIGIPAYRQEDLGVRINVVPLKETRVLSLSFPTESVQPYYKKKPLGYLAGVLGHEGKGSLHSYLKEKGLIDSLAAYHSDLPGEYSEFYLRMELTPKGLEQVDEITALIFDYIDLVRKEGVQQRVFNENKQVAELGFRFQEDRNPQQTASGLAARMHYLPANDILSSGYIYEAYDPELIEQMLGIMIPENLRQVVISQNLKTDKVEPYFETGYSSRPLSDDLIKRLKTPQTHAAFAISEKNEFIATDVELRNSDGAEEPEVIIDEHGLKVWSLTDTSFGMPRGSIHIMISSEDVAASPENYVSAQLYCALLSRSLNEYGYPAKIAGLQYSLSINRRGLAITLSGYQEKQKTLLKDILESVEQFSPDKAAFEQEKALMESRLKNKAFHAPYRQALENLGRMTYFRSPSDDYMLKALEHVTFDDVKTFGQDFYQRINVEMLVYGNHSQKEAESLARLVDEAILTESNRAARYHEPYQLLGDKDLVLNLDVEHDDSVFVSYYQMPVTDNKSRAQYALLGRLLANPFFNTIRTEQQLGYVVFAGARPIEKHPGVVFVVQSPKLDPVGIEQRVDAFLTEQVARLKQLSDEELQQYRQGLIGDLLKKDDNLDERSGRFWYGISSGELDFENRLKIAEEVRSMKPEDIQVAFEQILQNKGRVVVRSFGIPHKDAYKKETSRQECPRVECFKDLPVVH